MKERDVESAVVKRWPWKTYKLNGQGEVGKPDRLFVGTGGFTAFVEFKAPGEVPTPLQARNLAELRALGFPADWFDDASKALLWLKETFYRR